MNKLLAKQYVTRLGIKTPPFHILDITDAEDRKLLELFRTFPQPSVIKPINKGSSVGVTVARSFNEFVEGVRNAFSYSSKVLLEAFIRGKEATVGVIDRFRGKDTYSLLPVEIIPPASCNFFDYHAKYSGESREECPGNFSSSEKSELMRLAEAVHQGLGLRHYSRSDFIVSPRGIYFLEANTLPGLTSESLLPKSLTAVGSNLPEFLDHIITLAMERK
jgi:D-alanine-D-alanine ligase